jgi:predicted 2-oxoglutarate/Fe(II)-dependent dioxygenase YbiX
MRDGLFKEPRSWETYQYFAIHRDRFAGDECTRIIDLHQNNQLVRGVMSTGDGRSLRDSDIFWLPRAADTEWIFSRLWDTVSQYNATYAFELADEMGQAQLTRYRPGQHYEWHMDLGAGRPSLRKITAVVELTPSASRQGGGIEIFYGRSIENRLDLDIGDVILFPSFVMHRASMVDSGTRWSLVFWLNGTRPFR